MSRKKLNEGLPEKRIYRNVTFPPVEIRNRMFINGRPIKSTGITLRVRSLGVKVRQGQTVEPDILLNPKLFIDIAGFERFLGMEGVNVNAQDDEGMTPLHHAAALGARPWIRLLVKSGRCDYLIQDNLGRYASDIAIEWAEDYAVARLLAKHQLRQAWERGVPAWEPPPPRKLQRPERQP